MGLWNNLTSSTHRVSQGGKVSLDIVSKNWPKKASVSWTSSKDKSITYNINVNCYSDTEIGVVEDLVFHLERSMAVDG